ncbi:ABC transporter permease [Bariatricus massiliensis]|uniref:ABC transporter permease n=1 Tax=Bariatricus massiliensis TaxID=1745713 RepID=A0ABS8DMF3_9FIRM|nr:ABC transporter permease [Bariatricus massiliensis]MCB7305741.1 ABC transporter permease [Bariatricus massiliensis]MCB7376342.1 ABC transporter permease [Bariatricus massiliensis]MCB7388884.1 ABC transporter permease [Bariatricus massiliensis]MCB7413057.1 ABC transporter permease [Bariatricus massiliensis]MCQ5254998.1 ABC transporter permease [Bariatricus massiliensis]
MNRYKLAKSMLKYSRVFILIVLFAFFSIATDTFWSPTKWGNVTNIVLQQVPFLMLLAISMTLAILLNGIDLSIGSGVALISCFVGLILNKTYNPWLGIFGGIVMGLVMGLIMGILISKVKVSAFVTTYSMQWILRGFALVLLGGKQIYDFGPKFRPIFTSSKYTFFIISLVILLIMMFLLGRTTFGKAVYAIGKNKEAAAISGINTGRVITISYMISGVIIGLAAVLYIANLGSAEPVIGSDFAIKAIAATLIGGTAFGGGKGKMSNAFVGALIMLILTNGMIQIGVPSVWQQFVIGAVIIISIIMERGMEKLGNKVSLAEASQS